MRPHGAARFMRLAQQSLQCFGAIARRRQGIATRGVCSQPQQRHGAAAGAQLGQAFGLLSLGTGTL
jgi:hypothetical protein